jgi:hypothetical protein
MNRYFFILSLGKKPASSIPILPTVNNSNLTAGGNRPVSVDVAPSNKMATSTNNFQNGFSLNKINEAGKGSNPNLNLLHPNNSENSSFYNANGGSNSGSSHRKAIKSSDKNQNQVE